MIIDEAWYKKIGDKFRKKKKDGLVVLPWRHGVAENLKQTVNFIRLQKDKEFACVTKIQEQEFVTMPFNLYLKLLEAYKIAESLKEEEL